MNGHKFCGQCGSEINSEEKFCGKCGNPVNEPVVSEAPAPVQPAPVPVQTMPTQPVQPIQPAQAVASETPISTEKKSHKKLFIFGGIGIAAVTIAAVAFAIIINLPKTRTFLVYMIGSNLESEYSAGTLDIDEMISSDFDPEYNKVLLYTGGAKRWKMDGVEASENAIFEVSKDGLKKVQSFDKKVMTNPENLTEYIDYVYENYKTDYYDLVLWDHGGGPIVGYGSDENSLSGTPMSLTDLSSALGNSKIAKDNKKFEMIGFDACLMGSIEVGQALKNYSDYMVASEEYEPGWGWNYKFLGEINGKTTPEEMGKSIVDQFIGQYDSYPYKVSLSLSMVDLKKFDDLTKSADNLFSQVNSAVSNSNFSDYSRTMTRKRVYGYDGKDNESYDLVDLKDLASALEEKHSSEAKALISSVDQAVVYSNTNMDSTNGISIYFPTNNKKNLEKFIENYKDVSFSSDYYNFLTKYKDLITGKKVVSRGTYSDLKEKKDGDTVSIELTDELAENYQKGEIVIYRKLGDNMFSPIYRSSDVELDGKTLRTNSTNLQFIVEVTDGKTGEIDSGWIAIFERDRTEDYADYSSFGVLWYDANDGSKFLSPKSYEMELRVEKGSEVAEIRNIKVQNDDSGLSGKISFDIKNISILDMMVGTYKLFDENGNRLDALESWGKIYGSDANLGEGDTFEIKLVDLDYDFGNMYEGMLEKSTLDDYWAEFVVYDTQGESHRLNLIHIN